MNHVTLKTLCLSILMSTPAAFGGIKSVIRLSAKNLCSWQKEISGGCEIDLHRAAAEGNVERLRALLQTNKFDVNGIDVFGDTPLHVAVIKNCPAIIDELLQHGADINKGSAKSFWIHSVDSSDSYGATPFYLAVANGRIEVIRELLKHSNVDVFKPLFCGCSSITPLWMANNCHPEIIPMIQQYIKQTIIMPFATALHPRCGKGSPAKVLNDRILKFILLSYLMRP